MRSTVWKIAAVASPSATLLIVIYLYQQRQKQLKEINNQKQPKEINKMSDAATETSRQATPIAEQVATPKNNSLAENAESRFDTPPTKTPNTTPVSLPVGDDHGEGITMARYDNPSTVAFVDGCEYPASFDTTKTPKSTQQQSTLEWLFKFWPWSTPITHADEQTSRADARGSVSNVPGEAIAPR